MAEVIIPPIMNTKGGNLRLLKKKTPPAKNSRSAPKKISTPTTKLDIDPACHLEEAHRINNGRYGVATRSIRRYPYTSNHLRLKQCKARSFKGQKLPLSCV